MTTSLYQWGIIYDDQQKKRSKCHTPLKTPVKLSSNCLFVQVVCGTNFTLVLDSNGRVFVVGDEPKYGRLGLGDETSIAPQLTLIPGNYPSINSIHCGPSTSILLTRDQRELWGFGKGIGSTVKQIYTTDRIITHCSCNDNSIVLVLDEIQIEERHYNRNGFTDSWKCVYRFDKENNDRIHQLDLGSSFNGLVTVKGDIYLWGSNVPSHKPSKDEVFIDIPIKNLNQRNLPGSVNEHPISISCNRGQFHGHALLLTSNGHLYALGSNYKGKLGIDKNQLFAHQWMPIEMTVSSSKFTMVASGGIHSSALSDDGQVFTWGCGSDGRLGHVESEGHRYLYRENEPRSIESFSRCQTISIATSYYHMAAIVQTLK